MGRIQKARHGLRPALMDQEMECLTSGKQTRSAQEPNMSLKGAATNILP